VNFLFLLLGGLLYMYALDSHATAANHQLVMNGHNIIGDDIFPSIALHYLPKAISIIFIIGLISALFPSADGALTALTSSFCIDILGLKRHPALAEKRKKRIRMTVHISFALTFLFCILIFKWINNKSIINIILDLAGYTYGPLLGLFAFGICTKRALPQTWLVTATCLAAPACCFVLSKNSALWFHGYQIGYELLLIDGLATFLGLLILSKKPTAVN
jgi:Na+/proline symporter